MLEAADAETAEVAAEAIAAGLTKREIARLAAISRPTLDAILRRSEEFRTSRAGADQPVVSSSNGWQTAHRAEGEEALLVADSKVKARFNPAEQDLLWLNIELAEGGWTYLVIDRRTGDLKAQTFDVVKSGREKAREALAT